VKKDDKIKVLRGKFKGKEGKILKVNLKQSRVIVEGLQVSKMDGSKANVKMQPSNLQIIEMAERKTKKQENKTETTKNKESKTKLEEKKE
jgi:large subunit ribosomal protein L24